MHAVFMYERRARSGDRVRLMMKPCQETNDELDP